ncbi:restriction endonuclease [Limnohabitans sp. TS-CS-82]|uniref:restriction endonuclease subunit S n=1 Tax=Limnohabitans sp. TS-CS-82 TaxID=2094193 RepID=UPI000CF1FCC5|nr:restriction endonuclease subunit S [Limnohabitans sp. TS-CS-82]PQA83427.1 restriction endonuclease [Limnohabitans sp. TS-CS-82]
MSAELTAQEPSAKYLVNLQPPLVRHFDLIAHAPGGVARLRELILTLAVQGKLVPQDPSDEPASELLRRVATCVSERPAKTSKAPMVSGETSASYALPDGWAWCRLGAVVENMGSGWSPACDEGERSDPMRWAVLRTTAVQVNEYRAREHKALPTKLSPRPEIEVKDGDILITRAGPMNRVGISCWVNDTPPRLMLSDKIVRFHSIADEMLPAFIVLALNAGWTKDQIEEAKTGMAASQVNISQTDLRALWLPVCSKAEQSRIVTRVEELMQICDALEVSGQLEAQQHAQLVSTLLGTLTQSEMPEALADNWQRIATHFDLLLDRPKAVDALEQTILQLAVRGLLVPQDPTDEPASVLLQKIRTEKDHLISQGKIKRDKPLLPITDEEKPFELPQGWEWVRFPDVCSISGGATPSKAVPQNWEGTIPWVSPKDMKVPFIADAQDHVSDAAVNGSLSLIPSGSLLMVVRGMILAHSFPVADTLTPVTINQDMKALTPFEPKLLSFLALLCRGMKPEILALIDRSTHGTCKLESSKIFGLLIPLPPLVEQSRIVTRVNELRNLCADLRQRLAAGQTVQSHLADALVTG